MQNLDKNLCCTICGIPFDEGEVNNCSIAFNCLNTTISQEKAMQN